MDMLHYPRIGETVLRHTMDNGLAVIVVPRRDFERKYALFATRYGGMDQRFKKDGEWLDTPAGIAHYLEHKMFDTAEGNALQELAKNGAEPNAFTGNAMTAYYFDSTDHFYDNLKILLSFVSIPYFTKESVEKEQGIIGQEIGMIEDNPEWKVYQRLMEALYEKSTARTSVAGSVESISHITADTLYDCHKAFYTPANMCLVVVGDVDEHEVLRLAEAILPKKSGPAIERDYGEESSPLPLKKETRTEMEVAMPTFLAGFKCPSPPEGREQMRFHTVGELACDMLMGESSSLFSRLYADGLINGSFGYSLDILPGISYVYAGGDSKDPKAVTEAILAEARRVVREGFDPDYYERVIRANFGTDIKELNSFEGVAVSLAEGYFEGYDPYLFPEIYDTITQQDLLDFIGNYLVEERMALSVIDPKEEESSCKS